MKLTPALEKLFKRFGCNQREASIYLYLLQNGSLTVQEIARGLQVNRVTVHSAITQLLEKGFLYESIKGKRRRLVAEDPGIIERIFRRKEHEVVRLREVVPEFIAALHSMVPVVGSKTTVRFYEGVEGLKKLLDETLEASGEVLAFTNIDSFASLLTPAYLKNYFKRRAQLGIHSRLLWPPSAFAKEIRSDLVKYKVQVRELPIHLVWKAGLLIWNDSVAIQSYSHGHVSCTIIENPEIAHFFTTILFQLAWVQGERLR